MSVILDDALSQGLFINEALASGVPITMVAFIKSDDTTAGQTVISIADASEDNHYFTLAARGDGGGDPIWANIRYDTLNKFAASTAGFSSGTWHLASAVFGTTISRDAMIDGADEGSETTEVDDPTDLDKTAIGYLCRVSADVYFSGKIAHAAIWDVALSDAEILSIANGADPSTVQAGNLLAYWPLYDDANDDSGNGKNLTLLNSPTFDVDDNPSVEKAYDGGIIRVTGVATVSLATEVHYVEEGYPLPRTGDYDPDTWWDEESETWSSTYVTGPGSRTEYVLVMGEEGEIYFGVV